jgi:processive 1,2-diacylglycerol beta-glucosyltransferase
MRNPYTIHIVYEYGADFRPHASAYLRLIRPLRHPFLRDNLEVTFARDYSGAPADMVLIDRLWRPDVNPAAVEKLVMRVRQAGAQLVYALDDDFLTLDTRGMSRFTAERCESVRLLLREADQVLVTTAELGRSVVDYNPHIVVLPNMLDERLLLGGRLATPFAEQRLVIGYMGTRTHDDDLLLILPALKTLAQTYPGRLEFQLIGGVARNDTWESLADLPLRVLDLNPAETEYPLFMLWFTGRVRWDIALAPLADDPFNRCKSDVKFLDYSAIGAAGLYSRVPAYAGSVTHRETGWLVENTTAAWVEAVETLIMNAPLRERIAHKARAYLYSERIVARAAKHWLTALEGLLACEGQNWSGEVNSEIGQDGCKR